MGTAVRAFAWAVKNNIVVPRSVKKWQDVSTKLGAVSQDLHVLGSTRQENGSRVLMQKHQGPASYGGAETPSRQAL